MPISVSTKHLKSFVNAHEYIAMEPFVKTAHSILHDKTGLGSDFLGWVDLPSKISEESIQDINNTAKKIRSLCDILIVIGIGGSYLGARAAIEFVNTQFYNQNRPEGIPEIYFAGNSISPDYLNQLLKLCEGKDVCINVISKSGTTTEPAIAFRVFYKMLTEKYGDNAKDHIFCTTDSSKGAIKKMATEQDFKTFVIPDDIGGRFSVLTPVGLLPIAVSGIDIYELIGGAKRGQELYENPVLEENPCYKYAVTRHMMLLKNKSTEILVSYEPAVTLFNEWYKQLFGESEGKDHRGLFPASMIFSTDLHSLGQFVQDGSRNMFETVLEFGETQSDLEVKHFEDDFDGLNFLAGMKMSEINKKAMQGTVIAHTEGGVPTVIITTHKRDAYHLGALFYFFEKACAISGYMLGVNPFDQPGVEEYKRNMFALLNKPGFEDLKRALESKL